MQNAYRTYHNQSTMTKYEREKERKSDGARERKRRRVQNHIQRDWKQNNGKLNEYEWHRQEQQTIGRSRKSFPHRLHAKPSIHSNNIRYITSIVHTFNWSKRYYGRYTSSFLFLLLSSSFFNIFNVATPSKRTKTIRQQLKSPQIDITYSKMWMFFVPPIKIKEEYKWKTERLLGAIPIW